MSFSGVHTVNRRDFEEFGQRLGLSQPIVKREIDRFGDLPDTAVALIGRSFLPEDLKSAYVAGMKYRCHMVSNR